MKKRVLERKERRNGRDLGNKVVEEASAGKGWEKEREGLRE